METLAFLHFSLADEEPKDANLGFTTKVLKRHKVCPSGFHWLLLFVILSIVGMPGKALADTVSYSLPYSQTYRTLRLGSYGSDVYELQEHLLQLEYLDKSATGRFDTATLDAVVKFQQDNNLRPNGTVDRKTKEALLNKRPAPVYSSNYLENKFPSIPTRVVAIPPPAINDMGSSSYIAQSRITRELSLGLMGKDVEILQTELSRLGFFQDEIDGLFGFPTESAVRAFQQANGLPATGVADQQTLAILQGGVEVPPDPGVPNGDIYEEEPEIVEETYQQRTPYVVVIPARGNSTLIKVQKYVSNAFLADSRLGTYVHAGAFPDRQAAESHSFLLRSKGLDARVLYR
ncbi:MAG: peptidoglycan-binding protein [Moorea sp. SIO2B7]|nr:peptidoglycan-binding protein [Moorena sp. SIO2B7]